MNGVFITGTNTGVGKTWIGCQLVKYLYNNNIKVRPIKPVESGCIKKQNKYIAEDANNYFLATKGSIPEAKITPFRFTQVCSPARASLLSKQTLLLNDIVKHIKKVANNDETIIVEGAGGLCSPLTVDALNIDLIIATKLPVILIAEDNLGCLNSILLSLQTLEKHKIKCLAIILNKLNDHTNKDINNEQELSNYTQLPIIKNDFNSINATTKIAALLKQ